MTVAHTGLAYDSTPPLSAPLRFFLTAPLFGIAAGVVLMLDGSLLSSRWTPGALALVHLFAAGFMMQVMLGALLQILPVVAGASFPTPLRLAGVTHLLIGLGAASLAFGLGAGAPAAIASGGMLLTTGLCIFLLASVIALRRAPRTMGASHTPRDIRLALTALAVTALLGLSLAFVLGRGLSLPIALQTVVDLHAVWGWMGWGGVLLAATSWVVVPMFQITPAYPPRFTRLWAPLVLGALLLWTLVMAADAPLATAVLGSTLLALAAAFALQTFKLQLNTRRSVPDAPFKAFRLSMFAMLGGLLALLASLATDAAQLPVLVGVLILHGGFTGAISAMLYKIVPFLAWLNLTQAKVRAPNVKKLLPDVHPRRQLHLHTTTLLTLTAAVFWQPIAPIAGLLLVIEFSWLLANLLRVVIHWHKALHA